MIIDILTLFPKMFKGPFSESIIKRAIKKGLVKINFHNLRDYTTDKHKTVDDKPYGGGAGMVIKVDVIDRALAAIKKSIVDHRKAMIILLTPQGKKFNQKIAQKLSKAKHLILICGHYEGFDERVRKLVDEEISIGDYILTGGELPAMVLVDTIVRLLPGALGKEISLEDESFSFKFQNSKFEIQNLLEYPQYTRPEKYLPKSKKFKKPLMVPKVLLSGHHQKIKEWRMKEALKRTKKRRPDLLKKPHLIIDEEINKLIELGG